VGEGSFPASARGTKVLLASRHRTGYGLSWTEPRPHPAGLSFFPEQASWNRFRAGMRQPALTAPAGTNVARQPPDRETGASQRTSGSAPIRRSPATSRNTEHWTDPLARSRPVKESDGEPPAPPSMRIRSGDEHGSGGTGCWVRNETNGNLSPWRSGSPACVRELRSALRGPLLGTPIARFFPTLNIAFCFFKDPSSRRTQAIRPLLARGIKGPGSALDAFEHIGLAAE
jgi:hypothetical protein